MNKLIFVYNADSGIFATALDVVKKVVAPESQECNLCKVTYDVLSPKEEWTNFLATIPQEKKFLHRDGFMAAYPGYKAIALPAIFLGQDGTLTELVTAKEINGAKTTADLIALVADKIKTISI